MAWLSHHRILREVLGVPDPLQDQAALLFERALVARCEGSSVPSDRLINENFARRLADLLSEGQDPIAFVLARDGLRWRG
jgi:hypothetical protein